jgi:hypothetical protein
VVVFHAVFFSVAFVYVVFGGRLVVKHCVCTLAAGAAFIVVVYLILFNFTLKFVARYFFFRFFLVTKL